MGYLMILEKILGAAWSAFDLVFNIHLPIYLLHGFTNGGMVNVLAMLIIAALEIKNNC